MTTRSLWLFLWLGACEPQTEFDCTAWCLADSTDDGTVQNEVSEVIPASDLGEAVTSCKVLLTCNATPNDQTQCLCTEVR